MTNKSWKGPNDKIAPVPKDDGADLTIRAFQSREFNFGLPLTDKHFNGVKKHRNGKMHIDEEATVAKRQ
jgi:hypothetical protein